MLGLPEKESSDLMDLAADNHGLGSVDGASAHGNESCSAAGISAISWRRDDSNPVNGGTMTVMFRYLFSQAGAYDASDGRHDLLRSCRCFFSGEYHFSWRNPFGEVGSC